MTTALLVNIVLSAAVFALILSKLAWSIATQRSDRGHVFVARAPQLRSIPPQRLGAVPEDELAA